MLSVPDSGSETICANGAQRVYLRTFHHCGDSKVGITERLCVVGDATNGWGGASEDNSIDKIHGGYST